MGILEDNFKYFTEHHEEILRDYRDKFVVIKDQSVILAEDTFDLALEKATSQGLELGTFLIQECTEGDSGYTQTFHSRAIF